jgi:hypothetical protein
VVVLHLAEQLVQAALFPLLQKLSHQARECLETHATSLMACHVRTGRGQVRLARAAVAAKEHALRRVHLSVSCAKAVWFRRLERSG